MSASENIDQILAPLLPQGFGRYVDVGAAEPDESSNTISLYRRGWRGLLIEPIVEFCAALRQARPLDDVYLGAVGHKRLARLRVAQPISCSSFLTEWPISAKEHRAVQVTPLQEIVDRYPEIKRECLLLSVDVEGMEKEVLETIDFSVFRPPVMVLESQDYRPALLANDGILLFPERPERWPTWEPILLKNDYKFFAATETGLNRVYVRTDYKPWPA